MPARSRSKLYALGMDPASRVDFCGFAVISTIDPPEHDDARWVVEAVGRTMGVSYLGLEQMAKNAITQLARRAAPENARVFFAFDATGAGEAPSESLWRWLDRYEGTAAGELPVQVVMRAAILTAGQTDSRIPSAPWKIAAARAQLIGEFVLAAQSGAIDFTGLPAEQVELVRGEMTDFRSTLTPSGRERLEHKSGSHDDILFALALAFWIVRAFGPPTTVHSPIARPGQREPSRDTVARLWAHLAQHLTTVHGIEQQCAMSWATRAVRAYYQERRGSRESAVLRAFNGAKARGARLARPAGWTLPDLAVVCAAFIRSYDPADHAPSGPESGTPPAAMFTPDQVPRRVPGQPVASVRIARPDLGAAPASRTREELSTTEAITALAREIAGMDQ